MHRIRPLVIAAMTLALSFTGLSAASAGEGYGDKPPEVSNVARYVWADGPRDHEVVARGTYRCYGDSEAMHLWVSAKQGGSNLPGEGSGERARAWYDTNISQDVAVTCNGRWQTVDVDLGTYPDKGFIRNGKAWVQFCLVSPEGIVATMSRWVMVKGADGYGSPA
ncbi:MAG: hypothetical protein JWQ45_1234 [Blastococcus sp.]|nr:hypothetical protein [Blastococcus sp.]